MQCYAALALALALSPVHFTVHRCIAMQCNALHSAELLCSYGILSFALEIL